MSDRGAPKERWALRPPTVERHDEWRRLGLWSDDTLGAVVDRGLRGHPHQAFAFRSEVRPWRGTYGEVGELARRAAAGLARRGIGPGDIVAFQLPNWVEAAVTFYAVTYLGAVIVPIVHTYGPKEVGYILGRTDVALFVTADRFASTDYLAQLDQVRRQADALEHVVVVGDGPLPPGTEPFGALLEDGRREQPLAGDPDDPAVVAYTSGTTADPKGVVHSDRSLLAEIGHQSLMRRSSGRGVARASLVGAPLGHAGGMYSSLLTPLGDGLAVHMIDRWDPGRVLAAMVEDGLSSGGGVTYFLTSLLDHPDCTSEHHALIGAAGMGGAPVPPAVSDRAEALGITIFRSYGSTEHPSITGSWGDDPAEKRKYTDGRPLPGVELRLVDDDGREVAPDQPGEIVSRGPDLCLGYTDPDLTAEAFDEAGWFATGDIGQADGDGYVSIVDRKKDIIIRGGENVSALEVEELLLRLPGVVEVAVVAAPDARLGEHGCAFVRIADGPLELADVQAHLSSCGLGRQKWPEELRLVDELPRTTSGKVRKADLRQALREEAGRR
jgi:acyl-CoA synthetase (AMP-forming)/AMP-acid ligase II